MHLVYFSSGDVVILGKRDIEEALVISQIQINLSPSQNITHKVEIEHHLGDIEIKACRGETKTSRSKINLSAVVENKNLAVLEGRHGAGVDVQVRICMGAVEKVRISREAATGNGGNRRKLSESERENRF